MPHTLIPTDTIEDALKAAPRVCAVSLVGVFLIWAFHGLLLPVVIMSPVAGLVAFGFLIAYWHTKIAWLSGMQFVAVLVPMIAAGFGGLWHIVSGVLIAHFFQYLPLLVRGKTIAGWVSRGRG